MTVKKPSVWKQPLGNSADTQELVESSNEEASFNGLFPEIMEKSLADGGYPPKRTEFNALFKDIGDHLYYHQIGGTSDYSESTEYPLNAVVTYNNELYKAVKSSTGQTPTNENYWVKLATADDLSSLDVGDTYMPLYGGELISYSSIQELAYSTSGNVVTDEKVYTGTDDDHETFTVSDANDTLTFVNERYSKKVELSSIKYTSDIDLKISFTDTDGWIWYAFLGASGNIKTVVLDTTADDRVSWHLASEQTIVSDVKPSEPHFDVVNEVKNVIITPNDDTLNSSSSSFTLYKVCNCYTAKIDFKEKWNAELVKKYREDIASNAKSISEISETVENLSNSGDFVTVDKVQDITGTKTFVDNALKVNLTNIDTSGDVDDTLYGGISLTDKTKEIKGVVGLSLNTDKEIKTVIKSQSADNSAEISVTVDSSGVGKAFAPSSLNGTDSAQIATVDTVNDVKTELSTNISNLSTTIQSLSSTRAGDIGVAGGYGFGVGVFPGTQKELDDLGLSPMSGYDDPYNANYGNYMHKTAGVVVFIPKFYVRYGSSESPNYSKYGQNAVDVASAYDFTDDESAKKAGYFLHRAFYDDGKEKDGFFIGKYEASAGSGGNTSPISVVSQTGMNDIQFWYFIQYARNIGYGWNCATCFMHGALEVLMQAHGQASTYDSNSLNLTYYNSNNAWYDSTGTSNHPTHGYWSTDNTDIGIHAHNGQKCGVFGFYAHSQVGWGFTTPGSSSTDSSSYTSTSLYVLKRSAKFADMTEGWNGSVSTNDIWGTASFLSGKNYQVETSPWDFVNYRSYYSEGWSDGKARWTCSNGSATDYSSLSETDQDLFSVIPKSYSSTPTGTNLWDNSRSYFNLLNNSQSLYHGFDGGSNVGVFSRFFIYCRTDSYAFGSFRFAGFVS